MHHQGPTNHRRQCQHSPSGRRQRKGQLRCRLDQGTRRRLFPSGCPRVRRHRCHAIESDPSAMRRHGHPGLQAKHLWGQTTRLGRCLGSPIGRRWKRLPWSCNRRHGRHFEGFDHRSIRCCHRSRHHRYHAIDFGLRGKHQQTRQGEQSSRLLDSKIHLYLYHGNPNGQRKKSIRILLLLEKRTRIRRPHNLLSCHRNHHHLCHDIVRG